MTARATGKRLAILFVAAAIALAACSSSSKSSSSSSSSATTTTTAPTTTQSPDQAKAEITANFIKFFDGQNTDINSKLALLQDAQEMGPVFQQQAQANAATLAGVSATVNDITLTSPTTADVTFTLNLNGQPALPNFKGSAVYDQGTWKVSKAAFCDFAFIGAAQPPQCTSTSSSSSS